MLQKYPMKEPTITTPDELAHTILSGEFYRRWSPLNESPFVALDLAGAGKHSVKLIGYLHLIPCPVIGVGRGGDALANACDLLVPDIDNLRPLAARIADAPVTAMALVQLLRATEGMDIGNALAMESLAYATLQGGAEFSHWLHGRATENAEEKAADAGAEVLLCRERGELSIALNRPQARNEITAAMRDGLIEALKLAVADSTITAVSLSGIGKCFSVGGALSEFGTVESPTAAHLIRSVQLPARWMHLCADRITAHLHSACIGAGIEIPAFAGRVVAKKNAFFQLPELSMGLVPGAGGTVSIPRRIGRQRTAWLVISGRRIDAKTALNWGLVDELID